MCPESADTRNLSMRQYIQSLSEYRKEGKNGCIVMNCNPFTLGHQYLVEYASKRVDHLYLFVVEEDKSFFPFRDRLELVKKGVEKFPNVEVLPSGRFIISAYTFPGYFLKDGNKEIEMDASMDVEIFGKYIAKALDIRVRFVGEEPNDYVTRVYNDHLVFPYKPTLYPVPFNIFSKNLNILDHFSFFLYFHPSGNSQEMYKLR